MANEPNGNGNGISKWTGIIAAGVGAVGIIASMVTSIYNIQDRLTKIEVSMNEIETQFCSQDIVRNLMHANDMRIVSQLWEKEFGVKFPTDNAYYPTICNRVVKR